MTSDWDLSFEKSAIIFVAWGRWGVASYLVAQRGEKAQHIMKVNYVEIMRLVVPKIFEGVWGSSSRGVLTQSIVFDALINFFG